MQRCEITDLGVQECAHCRGAATPLPKAAPKERGKKRPTPPRRTTRAGNIGQRADGRYRVLAQRESKCEVCQFPVLVGDVVVTDDFGEWVHDRCCPEVTGAKSPSRPSSSVTPISAIDAGGERGKRTRSRRRAAASPALTGALEVYTDGACSGNPGPGGWAWVVDDERQAAGFEPMTTNQRMEIRAALEAIQALPGALVVVSDSAYVVNCFRDGWWRRWRKRSWTTTANKPVANRDLWEPLVDLVEARGDIAFRWVKGHSGNRLNDLADQLAVTAATTRHQA